MLNDDTSFVVVLVYIFDICDLKHQYCLKWNTWIKCIHFSSLWNLGVGSVESREDKVVCNE